MTSLRPSDKFRFAFAASVIVRQIAHGATWSEVLDKDPDLEREDVQQALEYAAWLTPEEVRIA